jgi:SAM-dependent methyltransferase
VREHWTGVYRHPATELSWHQAEARVSLELLDVAAAKPDDAILDVGAGASVLVDDLLHRGFRDVSVLDIAPAALESAQHRLGSDADTIHWIVADLLAWKPDRRYDVWHDRAVFHFLTKADDRRRYVAVLREAIASDGHVIVGTFAADGPRRCSGLPVTRYTHHALAEQFPGFTLQRARREEHRTPHGRIQPFNWVVLAPVKR